MTGRGNRTGTVGFRKTVRRRVARRPGFGVWVLVMTAGCGLVLAASGPPSQENALSRSDLPVILTIGESTTAGYGVPESMAYPAQLEALLGPEGYAYRVVNHGRTGSTTSMALAGLDRGLRLGPRIVVIALGGNDRSNRVPEGVTRENLRKLVSLFVRTGARVFIADRDAPGDGIGAQPTLFAELAAEEGATLIPSLRQSVAGRADLLLADGSHPNGSGYAVVARQVYDAIRPYLERP